MEVIPLEINLVGTSFSIYPLTGVSGISVVPNLL